MQHQAIYLFAALTAASAGAIPARAATPYINFTLTLTPQQIWTCVNGQQASLAATFGNWISGGCDPLEPPDWSQIVIPVTINTAVIGYAYDEPISQPYTWTWLNPFTGGVGYYPNLTQGLMNIVAGITRNQTIPNTNTVADLVGVEWVFSNFTVEAQVYFPAGFNGTGTSLYATVLMGTLDMQLGEPDGAVYQVSATSQANPCNVVLNGLVWYDQNGNSVVDSGEPGLNGVTVGLTSDEIGFGYSAVTGPAPAGVSVPAGTAGYYQFAGLCPEVAEAFVSVDTSQSALSGYQSTTAIRELVMFPEGTTPQTFNWGFNAPAPPSLSCGLTTAQAGGYYSSALSATGSFPPFTYSATGLPSWLTLNPTTGALTGLASGSGPVSFTAKAVDSRNDAAGTSTQSCTITVSPAGGTCASPATGISVARGGMRYVAAQKMFLQTDTLTNTSGSPIAAPIYLVLDGLSDSVNLANGGGQTTCNLPTSPYITVMNSGTLAPGASVPISLQFSDPSMGSIVYTTRVLTGEGQQ